MTLHILQDGCHVGKIERKREREKKRRGSKRCGGKEKEKDKTVIKDGKR